MRKKFMTLNLVYVALALVVAVAALAQPPDDPAFKAEVDIAAPAVENGGWRAMKVRNVRPSMIAWWIDPKNQPQPEEIQRAGELQSQFTPLPKPQNVTGMLAEIEGVQAIAASDAQNMILALADEAGWARFQKFVAFLDQPIRQVEIEMQVLEIFSLRRLAGAGLQRQEQIDKLPDETDIKFDENAAPQIISRKEHEARIHYFTNTGIGKIGNSPRVTTVNNMPVSLGDTVAVPVKTVFENRVIGNEVAPSVLSFPDGEYWLAKKRLMHATPSVNNDESITLFLQFAEPLYLMPSPTIKQQDEMPREFLLEKGLRKTVAFNLAPDQVAWFLIKESSAPQQAQPDNKEPAARYRLYCVSAKALERKTDDR